VCGIAGYWDKTEEPGAPVGAIVLKMLSALGCRGPDSAGVALYGAPIDGGMVVRVTLPEASLAPKITAAAERFGVVRDTEVIKGYIRFVIEGDPAPQQFVAALETAAPGVEVISMGKRLEIVKQVGSPENLDREYCVSHFRGTHGLGHNRLSTESRVDLSHSQPFWAHGRPDLAIVHNGHITNYHQLRRRYEQHGVRFYTENDSEIVAIYLSDRLSQGSSLHEALHAALRDLDGSFSCLAATADAFGYVKDPFALKPMLVCESDRFVAVANEEVAIRAALPGSYDVREAGTREVRIWQN
jgi:glutamate synthase domain-containing protein 1